MNISERSGEQRTGVEQQLIDAADQVVAASKEIDTRVWHDGDRAADAADHARTRADRIDERARHAEHRADEVRDEAQDATAADARDGHLREAELHERAAEVQHKAADALRMSDPPTS